MSFRDGRWADYARGRPPAGGRRLPAAILVLIGVGLGAWGLTHPTGGCSCGPTISFGRDQPGFRRIHGPPAGAVSRLPIHLRLAPAIGRPIGVYREHRTAVVVYGPRARYGIFRLTAAPRPPSFDGATLRDLASECDVCTDNRLVLLAAGVHGALLAGGNGPNSVTWLEHGLEMVVLGPAGSFGAAQAIAAARDLARANGRESRLPVGPVSHGWPLGRAMNAIWLS